MRAFILDLRFNPGGLLRSAIEVSDMFIKSGAIVSTEGRNVRPYTWNATAPDTFEPVANEVTQLLVHMEAAGLVHGDLKATNFLQTADTKRMVIIDYDALRSGDIAPDVQRFLANWEDVPELKARWRQRLAEAGL